MEAIMPHVIIPGEPEPKRPSVGDRLVGTIEAAGDKMTDATNAKIGIINDTRRDFLQMGIAGVGALVMLLMMLGIYILIRDVMRSSDQRFEALSERHDRQIEIQRSEHQQSTQHLYEGLIGVKTAVNLNTSVVERVGRESSEAAKNAAEAAKMTAAALEKVAKEKSK